MTLQALHLMVCDEDKIVVLDDRTGKHLSSFILTQITSGEPIQDHNMLPLNTLRQMLKYYNEDIGSQYSKHLEQPMNSFTQYQRNIMRQQTDTATNNQ